VNIVPLIIMGVLLLGLLFVSNRNKAKRTAADVERRKALVPGTRIMTTSGAYGTIRSIDPDNDGTAADTVVVELAPGLEVTWALAAVREAPQRAAVVDATPAAPIDLPEDAVTIDREPIEREVIDPTASDDRVRLGKPKGRTTT
jgi:preprotein translocase subunit YajC